jgi:hypothetical protein
MKNELAVGYAMTADGLRARLFDALDGIINKTMEAKDVESVCYCSEQILKIARFELESTIEQHKIKMQDMDREEKATAMLAKTIEAVGSLGYEYNEEC